MGSEYTLEEICEGIYDCPHSTPVLSESGPYMARTQDIRQGFFDTSSAVHVSEEIYTDRIRRVEPKVGDLLFSREGTYFGDAAEVPPGVKVCLGQRMVLLRPNQTIVRPRYLRILINSPSFQQLLLAYRDGTVAERLNLPVIRKLPVSLPSLAEQDFVIGHLSPLEEKIELNRQMNETLESMAQALFKSWFVDFEPVIDNALAAGNPIPEPLQHRAESRRALGDNRKPQLDDLRKQFPDRFVFTAEMGWVPEGWEIMPVNEAITVNPGVSLPKGKVAKYVDMKALPTSGFSIHEVIDKAYSGGAKYENGDVLLARITPCLENGKTGLVDFLDENEAGFGSTEFIVLRKKRAIGMPFVACLARDETFRQHCIQNMVGSSGRQRVQNSCFESYFLCLPKNPRLLQEFDNSCGPFFGKVTALKHENQSLTLLRDSLIPRLIAGNLRIGRQPREVHL